MNFLNLFKKFWYICLIVIVVIGITVVTGTKTKATTEPERLETIEKEEIIEQKPCEPQKIRVDIKGAVKKPGVYEVTEDNIIDDVIKLAGGLKSGGTTKNINLSKKVTNEMVIVISTINELNKKETTNITTCKENTVYINNCEGSNVIESNPSSTNKPTEDEPITTPESNEEPNQDDNKISINCATKEELMTISGIGESKALSIIKYREENGSFKNIDEIKNISGIGDSLFEKIKDYIKL